jgi:hypothetical protein
MQITYFIQTRKKVALLAATDSQRSRLVLPLEYEMKDNKLIVKRPVMASKTPLNVTSHYLYNWVTCKGKLLLFVPVNYCVDMGRAIFGTEPLVNTG